MNAKLLLAGGLAAVGLFTGCVVTPPPQSDVEHGPHGTIAYNVLVEASEPGVRIEVNGEYVGNAPLNLKIFGDKDGTFHDFGSYVYVIRALPVGTNQYVQTRVFRTGKMFTPQDRIPQRVFFDMNQVPPPEPYPYPPPAYYPPPPHSY